MLIDKSLFWMFIKTTIQGVVMIEWTTFNVWNGRWSSLSSLFMVIHIVSDAVVLTFTLIKIEHSNWNSLSASVNTSIQLTSTMID
jgi:hypothetical protein